MEPKVLKEKLLAMDSSLLDQAAKVCGLTLDIEELADQAALAKALGGYIADFPKASGWLCRQSDVVWFRDGHIPLDANIQYGEIAADASHSMLIRPDGCGGLRLIYQQECVGETHLAIPFRHIGRKRTPCGGAIGTLAYCTYWTRQQGAQASGYRAETTRLVRIAKAEVNL